MKDRTCPFRVWQGMAWHDTRRGKRGGGPWFAPVFPIRVSKKNTSGTHPPTAHRLISFLFSIPLPPPPLLSLLCFSRPLKQLKGNQSIPTPVNHRRTPMETVWKQGKKKTKEKKRERKRENKIKKGPDATGTVHIVALPPSPLFAFSFVQSIPKWKQAAAAAVAPQRESLPNGARSVMMLTEHGP